MSVVVLNYRTPDKTIRAVRSVGDIATAAVQFVVVDNASRDGSVDLIRGSLPEATVIEMPGNLGFAAGMNAGIRQCKGDYVLLLNSDIEALPGSVMSMLSYLRENFAVGLVAPVLMKSDGTLSRSLLITPTLGRAVLPFLAKAAYKKQCGRINSEPLDVESTEGAAVMVRKSVLDQVGLLDEGFFFYHEIDEWCLRMRDRGFRVALIPKARMLHACGASTGDVRKAAKIELKRSEYLLLEKRFGAKTASFLKARDFVSEVLDVVIYAAAVALTIGCKGRLRDKLLVHYCLLIWMLMGMPDRQCPGYRRFFGNWG